VKSGPDVFADALVPRAHADGAPRFPFPKSPRTIVFPLRGTGGSSCRDGYRFAKWQGKSNSEKRKNVREIGSFAISPGLAPKARLHPVHRDT
jgi:hypothetical protein